MMIQRLKNQCNTCRFHYVDAIAQVVNSIGCLIIHVKSHIITAKNNKRLFCPCPFGYFNSLFHLGDQHITNLLAVKDKILFARIGPEDIGSEIHPKAVKFVHDLLLHSRFPSHEAIVEDGPESLIVDEFYIIYGILSRVLPEHAQTRSIFQLEGCNGICRPNLSGGFGRA